MGKGIKVKAFQPFTITYASEIGGLNDAGGAEFLKLKSKSFVILQQYLPDPQTLLDVEFKVTGKGFKYVMDRPYDGVATKIRVDVDHELAYTFSGLKLDALTAAKLWQNQDPYAGFEKLLVGDDKVIGSEFGDTLYGFKGMDQMWARGGADIVDGGKDNDVNDGGLGNDYLADIKGEDRFQFSTELKLTASLNLTFNYDKIKFFGQGDDIYLKESIFPGIGGKLDKDEFVDGPAAVDGNDFIIWDNRIGYFDRDGSGSTYEPVPFFTTENDANITHKSFVMGVMYDGY